MNRMQFRRNFDTGGPVVLPVVHVLNELQAITNIEIAFGCGAHGVFLINHDFPKEDLIPILEAVRARFAERWIGVNFLATTGRIAFPILGELQRNGTYLDAYWADDARIDERRDDDDQGEAAAIDAARGQSGWTGLYFGGTAFKSQREVAPALHHASAQIAARHMDVVTTSGKKTGTAADLAKVGQFRRALKDGALALASGVTPENAPLYAPHVDAFLVATGINRDRDFYNIDPMRLDQLVKICTNSLSTTEETE